MATPLSLAPSHASSEQATFACLRVPLTSKEAYGLSLNAVISQVATSPMDVWYAGNVLRWAAIVVEKDSQKCRSAAGEMSFFRLWNWNGDRH